ncbi:MAG: hypothetical protein AAF989_04195 [Planctomycetota bacterium]
MGTDCWGTPIVSGDLVYLFGADGQTKVLNAGPEFSLVTTDALSETDAPPKPETYVEHSGGGHHHGGGSGEESAKHGSSERGGRGRGMIAAMMAGDKNGDGILQSDEISPSFQRMLTRVDTNQDGSLDAEELNAMEKSFAARRAESRASARDPVVYGFAASNGSLMIRTGTRLHCVR